ncbi:hypothetical protein Tco_0506560 [Tanacetum coccineum]
MAKKSKNSKIKNVTEKDNLVGVEKLGKLKRARDSVMAFRIFDDMEDRNEVSWTTMILGYVGISCVQLGTISLGKVIHGYSLRHGLKSDVCLISLAHLYLKHEDLLSLHKQSVEKSISLFNRMQNEGVQANYVTLLPLLTLKNQFQTSKYLKSYLRWERNGKPTYPEQEKEEFEEARKELQRELEKGTSLDYLRKKMTKGEIQTEE